MTANLKRFIPAGADEANVVASGTNLSQVIIAGTGTATYEADCAMQRSTVGVLLSAPGATDQANLMMSTTAAAAATAQAYLDFSQGWAVSAAQEVLAIRTTAGNCVRMFTNAAGSVTVQDKGGVTRATLGTLPSLGTYRFEAQVTPGTTTANGTAQCFVYDDNDTLVFSSTLLTGSYGGDLAPNTPSIVRCGDPTTATITGMILGVGPLAIDTAATPPAIPPVAKAVNAAPTANAGSDQTVDAGAPFTLTGSGSDTDGTIASSRWLDGATQIATGTGYNGTAPVTLTGTSKVYTFEVTDDDGAIGTDTMTLTVNPASTRLSDGTAVRAAVTRLT